MDVCKKDQSAANSLPARLVRFPLYQLLVLHILPMLHRNVVSNQTTVLEATPKPTGILETQPFHALLTSHHFISPTKRRLIQQWSASLSVSGFAKVGYPGIIYGQGAEENIREFVARIKAMQWLALRVRFVEPMSGDQQPTKESRHWLEFQKVGEVVTEMKRLGREGCILDIGIGSAASNSK